MRFYSNTKINEVKVGWRYLPEHCVGDPSSDYVLHDHDKGKFYFCNFGDLAAEQLVQDDPDCYDKGFEKVREALFEILQEVYRDIAWTRAKECAIEIMEDPFK